MQHHPYAMATALTMKAITGSHPGPPYYAAIALAVAAIIAGSSVIAFFQAIS